MKILTVLGLFLTSSSLFSQDQGLVTLSRQGVCQDKHVKISFYASSSINSATKTNLLIEFDLFGEVSDLVESAPITHNSSNDTSSIKVVGIDENDYNFELLINYNESKATAMVDGEVDSTLTCEWDK